MKEREEKLRMLAMLRYQFERYLSVRNGLKCQQINDQIRLIESELYGSLAAN
jgi:hypothetical protein